jgi:hypothetical protein
VLSGNNVYAYEYTFGLNTDLESFTNESVGRVCLMGGWGGHVCTVRKQIIAETTDGMAWRMNEMLPLKTEKRSAEYAPEQERVVITDHKR